MNGYFSAYCLRQGFLKGQLNAHVRMKAFSGGQYIAYPSGILLGYRHYFAGMRYAEFDDSGLQRRCLAGRHASQFPSPRPRFSGF